MAKKLISVILVLFTMFALSAATVKVVEPNGDVTYNDKVSFGDEICFKVYDSFALCFAFDTANTKTTCYKDGSLKVEYTNKDGTIMSIEFDKNEKDEIKFFADMCESYTMINIQQKLLK